MSIIKPIIIVPRVLNLIGAGLALFGCVQLSEDENRYDLIERSRLSLSQYIRYREIEIEHGSMRADVWRAFVLYGKEEAILQYARNISATNSVGAKTDDPGFTQLFAFLVASPKKPELQERFVDEHLKLEERIPDLDRRRSFWERLKDSTSTWFWSILCLWASQQLRRLSKKRRKEADQYVTQ